MACYGTTFPLVIVDAEEEADKGEYEGTEYNPYYQSCYGCADRATALLFTGRNACKKIAQWCWPVDYECGENGFYYLGSIDVHISLMIEPKNF